ncbi:sugar phosphate isomerase [Paenibacillus baekrokdamisoli]|uniref:Sugar phosphate isomerase n=1 Tax=Paenibacillus baekrokdamisoli TaxID=1712516 RepID=A0A3G9ISY7_9BACL|nr:sugar phosphate isomerase/epimerase family protein [Paenibacillus baekrokdamisoli]MBB3070358.1 sugar phosphate isomerase/epimerase [Paenibacillus baekrokdamisoli]BBH21362.1 sugar phosphate isomerase [Paenibacillus baekrokdamisoli]
MLRGLSGAGLGRIENDESLIELAAKYGFQAVDIDAQGLIERHGVEGARELLKNHNLVIGSIGLPVEWRSTDDVFREGIVKLAQAAAAAAALGCTSCCTYILPSTDMKAAHFTVLATRRLRICAQILGAYGIRLGLEFVGPHHLRTAWKNPFIWTLEETLDWIDAIGEPNVGLLFDAYHWYTNELTVVDIERLRADQIVHVHINDAIDVPVADVLDNGRVYPGEGVIDLAGFLRALHTIGYKGAITQEILTAESPTDSPETLAERSKAGFDKVYTAAGL